jgi:hypothetical protein
MKYTKGEWYFAPKEYNQYSEKEHGEEFSIGSIKARDELIDGWFICRIDDAKEAEANAKLIASSPNLYEALKALVEHFRSNDENYYKSDLCTDAIVALRKAEGKE